MAAVFLEGRYPIRGLDSSKRRALTYNYSFGDQIWRARVVEGIGDCRNQPNGTLVVWWKFRCLGEGRSQLHRGVDMTAFASIAIPCQVSLMLSNFWGFHPH